MQFPKFEKDKFLTAFKKFLPFLFLEMAIFAGILALDLCLKDYLFDAFIKNGGQDITVIEKFFSITFVKNTASGLGLFKSLGTIGLSVIMCIAASAIIIYLNVSHKQSEWLRIPLIFMAAGGIGNVVDRIGLGYVRDFFRFEFSFFPYVFNVADIFVTVGAFWLVIVLIVELFKEGKKNKQAFEQRQATNEDKPVSDNKEIIDITTFGVGDEFLDKNFQQYNDISNDLSAVNGKKNGSLFGEEKFSNVTEKSNTDNLKETDNEVASISSKNEQLQEDLAKKDSLQNQNFDKEKTNKKNKSSSNLGDK